MESHFRQANVRQSATFESDVALSALPVVDWEKLAAIGRGSGVEASARGNDPANVQRASVEPAEKSILTGSQAKTAFALRQNCARMIDDAGLECAGFLTLTVGDVVESVDLLGDVRRSFVQVRDAKEASRRINNLNRRLLRDLFERAVVVTERHKSGKIHFHVLGILRGRPDIRTGFDFEALERLQLAVKQKRRRSFSAAEVGASPDLARMWKLLRDRLQGYGFGRAELTPIKKSGAAVADYVAKYIQKNISSRGPEDKGKKLVRYIGDWGKVEPAQRPETFAGRVDLIKQKIGAGEPIVVFGFVPDRVWKLRPNDFSWAGKRALAWWSKASAVVDLVGWSSIKRANFELGPRWAWKVCNIWREVHGDDTQPGFPAQTWGQRRDLRQMLLRENVRWWSSVRDGVCSMGAAAYGAGRVEDSAFEPVTFWTSDDFGRLVDEMAESLQISQQNRRKLAARFPGFRPVSGAPCLSCDDIFRRPAAVSG